MRNMQSPDNYSEHNERGMRKIDTKHYMPGTIEEQLMLDYLLEAGFQWEEAVPLLTLRAHLYDNPEMRQRMADDYRIHFVKWLYEQGMMNEG